LGLQLFFLILGFKFSVWKHQFDHETFLPGNSDTRELRGSSTESPTSILVELDLEPEKNSPFYMDGGLVKSDFLAPPPLLHAPR